MWEDLARVCELQPLYSSQNTPAMRERGEILRHRIKPAIEELSGVIAPLLGRFGDDFSVDASDGVGRKTELPWVRFCSSSMSPAATQGFYFVMHFSTDGSAVHFTIGSGSSRFKNGEFVLLPSREVEAQTIWARAVILDELGTLAPFEDPAEFGATRPLPKAFERATVISHRVEKADLETTDLTALMTLAAERLKPIYEAQATGRDLSPADIQEAENDSATNPTRKGSRRQGYGLSVEARRAVELRAMDLAREWLEIEGFRVSDRSATASFDFEARREEEVFKVEVKGTTSDFADAILMTRNEVDLHRAEKGKTCLIIVSKIKLSHDARGIMASEGEIEVDMGWDIDTWMKEPTAYRVSRS